VILAYNYGINSKYNEIKSTTGADGSFALTYKSDVTMGDLVIRGRRANGQGALNYLFGIPKNKTLDVGNIYQSDNFFALVKIEPKRATTSSDTIYYKRVKSFVYQQYIVGPFFNGQVIDTMSYRNTQFYDFQNKSAYHGDGSFPYVSYAYTIGKNGKEKHASNESFIPCSSNNSYQLIIE
jgi:hypothetical protein